MFYIVDISLSRLYMSGNLFAYGFVPFSWLFGWESLLFWPVRASERRFGVLLRGVSDPLPHLQTKYRNPANQASGGSARRSPSDRALASKWARKRKWTVARLSTYARFFDRWYAPNPHEYWISTGLSGVFAKVREVDFCNILFFLVFPFAHPKFSTGSLLSF